MGDSREQNERQYSTGLYLAELRGSKHIGLTAAARSIGISPPYLKEIEKGLKLPSDLLIRSISDFYGIPEDDLFKRFGKIPLLAREQFEDMPGLQKVLSDIRKRSMSEDQRQQLFDEITSLYKNFLGRLDESSSEKNKDGDK